MPKRLGDAYLETQLVRQAVVDQTGQRWLSSDYGSDSAQMKALLDNAIDQSAVLDLTVGQALTADQVASLDRDIIWYVSAEVDGQIVLEPRLYLASASRDTISQTGATIAANDDLTLVSGANVTNDGGALASARDVAIKAQGGIANTSGKIAAAGAVDLTAVTGDVINVTKLAELRKDGSDVSDVRIGRGEIAAGTNLTVSAGSDIASTGADVTAGGTAELTAGRDVVLGANALRHEETGVSKKSSYEIRNLVHDGSSLSAELGLSISAGRDVAISGSTVDADGDVNVTAGRDVNIASVVDQTYSHGVVKKRHSYHEGETSSKINKGSVISAEGDLTVNSGGSTSILASDLGSDKDIAITAGTGPTADPNASINILSEQDYTSQFNLDKRSKIGLSIDGPRLNVATNTMTKDRRSEATNAASSVVADGQVTLITKQDVNIAGSLVNAGSDVSIDADRDITVVAGKEAASQEHVSKKTSVGVGLNIGNGEIGVSAGTKSVEEGLLKNGSYNASSAIQAGNDLSLDAGRNVNQLSSHFSAENDVSVKAGGDIVSSSAQDVEQVEQYRQEVETGLKLAVRENISSVVRAVETTANATQTGGDGAETAANTSSAAVQAVLAGYKAITAPVSASIGFGMTMSEERSSTTTATSVLPTTAAGNDLTLDAGNNISLTGTQVIAGNDLTVKAIGDLTVESAQDTYSSSQSSRSASTFVGANISLDGQGILNNPSPDSIGDVLKSGNTVSGSYGQSQAQSQGTTQRNAMLSAGDTLRIETGGNTTLAGANLSGDQVDMEVGGDLDVISRTDTGTSSSSSSGASVGLGLGAGVNPLDPSSESGGLNAGQGDGHKAWVSDQTGIIGGSGVDIRVEKTTTLEGSVIAALNDDLTLDTGDLKYKDIQGVDESTRAGLALGFEDSDTAGQPLDTIGIDYAAIDREQANRATIGGGTIIIRSDPSQGIEGLNRDLAKAQEITKDTKTQVSVIVPVPGGETAKRLEEVGTFIGEVAKKLEAALAEAPPAATKAQLTPEEIKKAVADFKKTLILEGVNQGSDEGNFSAKEAQIQQGVADALTGVFAYLLENGVDESTATAVILLKITDPALRKTLEDSSREALADNTLTIGTEPGLQNVVLPLVIAGIVLTAEEVAVLMGLTIATVAVLNKPENREAIAKAASKGIAELAATLNEMVQAAKAEDDKKNSPQPSQGADAGAAAPPPDDEGNPQDPGKKQDIQSNQSSKPLLRSKDGSWRIDVENVNTREGQIHIQTKDGKWLYDELTSSWKPDKNTPEMSRALEKELAKNPAVQRAIEKGLKYLGKG